MLLQERVRKDIIEWLRWLRNSIGFDGWRFDFVKVGGRPEGGIMQVWVVSGAL